MDVKKKIIIKGQRVHDVGYRPFLLGIAESMEIERFFAKNILMDEKQVVHALVNSYEEKVEAFIDIVSSEYPEKSVVESVEVEDFIGNVTKIESYYRYLTAMQLSKIATYGGKMLEKQENTIGILQDLKQDTSYMRKEIRTGLTAVKEEIHMQRNDFKEVFMLEVSELRVEIAEVKCTLARMQAEA
jgi:acylphosphatase